MPNTSQTVARHLTTTGPTFLLHPHPFPHENSEDTNSCRTVAALSLPSQRPPPTTFAPHGMTSCSCKRNAFAATSTPPHPHLHALLLDPDFATSTLPTPLDHTDPATTTHNLDPAMPLPPRHGHPTPLRQRRTPRLALVPS
ncbi:hypothetical protein EDB85DRAFT_1896611 [Lactarius pseudohatsudake]|nr:hypothetical protein EDB85DRAFT_1896611 [Lactarius pseudohatsudake]